MIGRKAEILEGLANKGFASIEISTNDELLELGRSLGNILPSRKNSNKLIDVLVPKGESKYERSISAIYGLNEFPFHTDGAYMPNPPRYLILRNVSRDNKTDTLLKDLKFDCKELRELQRAVWYVNGGRGRFYTSIISSYNEVYHLRYDKECMRPAHKRFFHTKAIMEERLINSNTIRIGWRMNQSLIIDNWRILHARDAVGSNINRRLQRVWILKV